MLASVSWPKLIGAIVGGIGVSGLLGSAPLVVVQDPTFFDPWDLVPLAVLLCCVILSYPLARGHEWARRVVVAAVILIGLYFFLRAASRVVTPHQFGGPPGPLDKWLVAQSVLGAFGDALLNLILPLSIIAVLSHPDVVSSFRKRHVGQSQV